jgi:hypothetical protein
MKRLKNLLVTLVVAIGTLTIAPALSVVWEVDDPTTTNIQKGHVDSTGVYVLSGPGLRLQRYDVATGTLQWTSQVLPAGEGSGADIAVSNLFVAVTGSWNNLVYTALISKATGATLWQRVYLPLLWSISGRGVSVEFRGPWIYVLGEVVARRRDVHVLRYDGVGNESAWVVQEDRFNDSASSFATNVWNDLAAMVTHERDIGQNFPLGHVQRYRAYDENMALYGGWPVNVVLGGGGQFGAPPASFGIRIGWDADRTVHAISHYSPVLTQAYDRRLVWRRYNLSGTLIGNREFSMQNDTFYNTAAPGTPQIDPQTGDVYAVAYYNWVLGSSRNHVTRQWRWDKNGSVIWSSTRSMSDECRLVKTLYAPAINRVFYCGSTKRGTPPNFDFWVVARQASDGTLLSDSYHDGNGQDDGAGDLDYDAAVNRLVVVGRAGGVGKIVLYQP